MLDMIKSEEEVLKYWKENRIMAEIRAKNRNRKPFYFLDGPPFVSGDLHPGQMWVKSMKDVLVRYKRMRGFDVYDRAGYDVHGLPIELRAEANLGVKTKKDIETKIGIEKFIQSCKEYVEAYIGRMDADYDRFGISLDFSNPYLPYKNSYIETEWGLFKAIYEKGLVYKEKKAVPYCTRCGTALSQGSMEVVYQNDTDPSIFVIFKILKSPKISFDNSSYLLVWTTTPWTLPANMSIAVNPEAKYVLAKFGDKKYVVAKERLDAVVAELNQSAIIENEFYGSELVGTSYQGILVDKIPMQASFAKYHRVIGAKELVSEEEGTGLVHIAPGHGLEDYVVGKKNKLPVFSPIDADGYYTGEAGAYKGLKVPEEANQKILEDLKASGALVSEGTVTHSYPHCWRCNTKLIYISTDQWFINIQKVKKKIIAENRKVKWHPEEAQKWQEELLVSSPDWAISRQRYWGVPMPIWESDDGEIKVIGSLDELKKYAVNKEELEKLTDLHRPYIDRIVLKSQTGKEMHRIKDVFDVWFDSSIAFRASLTEEQFNKLFPVDFVLEAVEQLRGWFAYQLKTSVMVYGKRPFKHVVMHGMMLGEDGRELHKHLGNYIPLNELLKKVTADSFRLWCVSHNPRLDLLFRIKDIDEANKVILLFYNIANLFKEYSEAIGYTPRKVKRPSQNLDYEDAWIVSRLNETIKDATNSLDAYDIEEASKKIRDFAVEDFSRFYLKIAKKKITEGSRRIAKKKIDLINYIIYNTLLIASPIIPFATERIYLDLFGDKKSIFLNDWPKHTESRINEDLEKQFREAINAITALLNAREKAGIKLRQPLERATLEVDTKEAFDALAKLQAIIEDYTNIKHIEIKESSSLGERVVPVFKALGPEFKENAQAIANALKSTNPQEIEKAVSETGYFLLHTEKGTFQIKPEHFSILKEKETDKAVPFEHGLASVDTAISEELKEEALVREIERRIQLLRKELLLKKAEKIEVNFEANKELEQLINKNATTIKKTVNATSLNPKLDASGAAKTYKIDEEEIKLQIKKRD
ncbi:MAG: isoleucine--tRNA ligase [Candidatus Micrarchaeia archaeon]